MAHSQGNVVAGQALRILPADSVKAYIATQAAISGHCYGSMVNPTVTKDGETTTVIIDNIVTNADGLPDIYKYYYSGNPFYQSGTPPAQDKPYLDEVAEKTNMVNCYNREDYALVWWKLNMKWPQCQGQEHPIFRLNFA